MRTPRLIILFTLISLGFCAPVQASSDEYLVLGIDVSGSMRGPALDATVKAAEKIVLDLEGERRLEIFTFTRTPTRLDDPDSINTLTSGGYTALYDSIWRLALRAREIGAPLIVLTDGKDSRSYLSPSDLIERFDGFPVSINFITYNPLPEGERVLADIAAETGGKLFAVAQSGQLIQVFKQAVKEIDQEPNSPRSNMPILLSATFGLLTLAGAQIVRNWRRRESYLESWEGILEDYEVNKPDESVTEEASRIGFTDRILGDTSQIAPRIKGKVQRESIFFAFILGMTALLATLGLAVPFALLAAFALAFLIVKLLARRAEVKSRLEFENELPGSLRLIASSLTAGLSFLQALDSFSKEGNSRVAREFRRALSEIQMGSPIERSLGDVAERMKSEDLKWVVFAFSIQREVGGGLAKILQTSAETIDARSSLRQEMRTLSTEGRISSYILMLLPPGIFFFLLVTRRDFISMFWEESIGQLLLLIVVTLMTTAWIWIRRLVNFPA